MGDNSIKSGDKEWLYNIADNETAFRQMFDYYYAGLCLYAQRFIPDIATCKDLVQDTFCSIWINRKKIDYSIPVRNYLLTSVKNRCLNYLRKYEKLSFGQETELEKIPVYIEDNEEDLFLLRELEEKFTQILSGMPDEYRIAFEMSRMEDCPTSEIAEALGVSVRTVERYRNKAIEILKTELKDYLPLLYLLFNIRL